MSHRKEAAIETIEIRATLTDAEAWHLAQFLKRACFGDYRERATSESEAHTMIQAGDKIREALRQKGYAPR